MPKPAQNPQPRFSVVVPLFNKEPYIERALRSALDQAFLDFELIVVDDGSTDQGPEKALALSDPRIRVVRQANAGTSAARNHGIRCSAGTHVAFLDADDLWNPDHLEVLSQLIEKFPMAGIYATNYWHLWPYGKMPARIDGVPLRPDWEGLLPNYLAIACGKSPPVMVSSACVPRPILDEFGGFLVDIRTGEDLDLWLRIALKYPVAFHSSRTAVYDRQASDIADRYYPEEEALLQRWRTYVAGESHPDFERYLARKYLDIARKQLLIGDRTGARRTLSTVRISDWRLRRWLIGLACYVPSWGVKACLKVKHALREMAAKLSS